MNEDRPTHRSLTALDGAISLIAILLIVQMWLLTATLEAFLAGHHEVATPGAILSGLLFAASFGLYRFIEGIDRASRGGGR
ncbi:MAG: hypothetical protein KBH14_00850 [Vicinamibacteria bacterium]|jgi:hypothetical protein|nr:hypothetical protein [Vicinamibacteria bacterium]MBP9944925.1 hypothetical protein [Vicinamibacteria bacterium]